jgi:hypothetical protein
MPRSRKLNSKIVISKTGVSIESIYCRKCMKEKKPVDFFNATDSVLDSNGYMSICKDCINDLYSKTYAVELSMERTLLKLCRMLNVQYNETAILSTKLHLETLKANGKESDKVFGVYKLQLMAGTKGSFDNRTDATDMTFVEPSKEDVLKVISNPNDNLEYYHKSWIKGLNIEDYQYLEQEYEKWKKTTAIDNQGIEILVREIVYKQNDIRKERLLGNNVDSQVKSLQEIMKNSALTPALQNAAMAGKAAESFGNWIKDIETYSPAEWYDQQEKFHDMDGMSSDIKDIIRSVGTFITGSKDFNIDELEEMTDLENPNSEVYSDGG